jgi:hypothetical protein
MTIFTIERLSSPQRIHFFSAARWWGVDLTLGRQRQRGIVVENAATFIPH